MCGCSIVLIKDQKFFDLFTKYSIYHLLVHHHRRYQELLTVQWSRCELNINGLAVEEKDYAKYLGVLIDNKLSFEKHIEHVNGKLTKGNAILSLVRHLLPKQILINTYHAYIQPHIDYCLNVWGHTYKTHLTTLERQQRKAVRLMNFANKRDDPTDFFKNDKILKLDQSIKLTSAKLIWKASKNLPPSPVNSLFNKRAENNSFHLPYRRLDLTQRTPLFQGVLSWNQIPENIRSSKSLNILKTSYKTLLLSQQL